MLELAVLGLLLESPMHGYELRKRLTGLLGAFRAFSYGSLYPALRRMQADGLIVEAHPRPEEARSDKDQALLPNELAAIVADARVQAAVNGRQFHA